MRGALNDHLEGAGLVCNCGGSGVVGGREGVGAHVGERATSGVVVLVMVMMVVVVRRGIALAHIGQGRRGFGVGGS